MRKLTQPVLELACHDSGQEEIQRSAFDLADHTRACVDLGRPLAKEQNVHRHRSPAGLSAGHGCC